MRTAANQVVGPGRLPCRMFGVSGNLTGDGVEAQMWADVDGPGLLSYYYMQPEAVAALRYDNSRQLVRDIWAFMRSFTGDLRFDNASWIDEGFKAAAAEAEADDSGEGASAQQPDLSSTDLDEHWQWQRRQQMAAATEGPDGATEGRGRLVESQALRRPRHGPMRVYRSSATRVVVKAPTGCKYRYTVNPDSEVFDSPARHRTHVEWRTVLLTAASLSVVLTLVGLGVCTYFSRRHAEYVASYWEYQAVKDQLGSQLPPSTYVRLFGEQPKAAAAEAAAAATAAALVAAAARNAGAAAPAAAPPAESKKLSPAAQRRNAAEPRAEAGEPPVVGAGEPDGIGSRSSSASDSGIAAGGAAAK